jgi:hypothetical protein
MVHRGSGLVFMFRLLEPLPHTHTRKPCTGRKSAGTPWFHLSSPGIIIHYAFPIVEIGHPLPIQLAPQKLSIGTPCG